MLLSTVPAEEGGREREREGGREGERGRNGRQGRNNKEE